MWMLEFVWSGVFEFMLIVLWLKIFLIVVRFWFLWDIFFDVVYMVGVFVFRVCVVKDCSCLLNIIV